MVLVDAIRYGAIPQSASTKFVRITALSQQKIVHSQSIAVNLYLGSFDTFDSTQS